MDESVLMICDGEKSIGIAGINSHRLLLLTIDIHDTAYDLSGAQL